MSPKVPTSYSQGACVYVEMNDTLRLVEILQISGQRVEVQTLHADGTTGLRRWLETWRIVGRATRPALKLVSDVPPLPSNSADVA